MFGYFFYIGSPSKVYLNISAQPLKLQKKCMVLFKANFRIKPPRQSL